MYILILSLLQTAVEFSECPTNLNHSFIFDGLCDDELNTEKCQYDGGDCCLVELLKDKCEVCECFHEVEEPLCLGI